MNEQQKQVYQKKAVALSYLPESGQAPIVKAKGKGHVADEIIQKAKEHGIPIQEDPALVTLLSQVDIDQEIPSELYAVVAEIMALVYRMEKKAADTG